MNKFIKAVIVTVVCFAMGTSVMGAGIKCSGWATEAVTSAAEKGFVPESLLSKANEPITRKEMCSLIMQYYRVYTGDNYISLAESQFTDEKSKEVVTAVELGLFSGVSNKMFKPNEKVTREQMASVMARLFNKVGLELIQNTEADSVFNDNSKIGDWAKASVALLKKNGIINGDNKGYFNPKAITTIEQVIAVLMQTQPSTGEQSVMIGDLSVSLGENVARVLREFGQPTRIDKNKFGTQRYVYADNYEKFFMVGISNGKVTEIYTNASSLGYCTITSKTTYNTMKFDNYKTYSWEKAVYEDDKYVLTVFFDCMDNRKVDAIYLRSSGMTEATDFYNKENEAYVESELVDIINASRVKMGMTPFKRNSSADAVAKAHSDEMMNFLRSDYNSRKGLTPFQRMDEAGIKYGLASENIFTEVSGDAIEIYGWWISNVATRSNLLSKDFTNIGIGSVGSSKRNIFYTTADMFSVE